MCIQSKFHTQLIVGSLLNKTLLENLILLGALAKEIALLGYTVIDDESRR